MDRLTIDQIESANIGAVIKLGQVFLLFFCVWLAWSAFTIRVPAGYRGVLMNWGAVETDYVLGEGLHFKIPVMQSAKVIEVRTQKYAAKAASASLEMQDVTTTVVLNYHIDADNANLLYQKYGLDYQVRIIEPKINHVVKSVTAKFTAVELLTNRSQLRDIIKQQLVEELSGYYIAVDEFSVTNIEYDKEFTDIIEAKAREKEVLKQEQLRLETIKVRAQQMKEEAQGEADAKVALAEAEAKERLLLAEADARAIELAQRQLERSPVYVEYTRAKALLNWNGQLPQITGNSMPIIPFDQVFGQTGD